jgi:uncharacterized protein YndB with AHSA1/START domain
MSGSLRLSAFIPAPPAVVYHAWLNGRQHAAMTGAKATSQARVGGKFTAWDGYIFGQHLELVPDCRIVQSWRTTEFPEDCPDSRLQVDFVPEADGTRLTLIQSDLPAGEAARYQVGWQQFYFEPIQRYFERLGLKSSAVSEPQAAKGEARSRQPAAPRASKLTAKRTAKQPARRSRKAPAKQPAARPKRPKPVARRTKAAPPKTRRKAVKPPARRKRARR